MNEEHNTINQQREIWWYDGEKVPHQITKVVYCDQYRTPHTIWPCTIELRDVQIVKLSKSGQDGDISYPYHVDTTTLIPTVSLIPGEVYSVKGTVDVYGRPGELEKRIKDCYFFPETSSSLDPEQHSFLTVTGNEAHSYGSRTAKAYDTNDTYLGEDYVSDYSQYVKWGVSSDIEKTGRIELQGGWYNERLGYVQNGYIFDGNYTTRMIFRRATLSQDIALLKIAGNNPNSSDVINSPIRLTSDQTIVFWPKLHKWVSDSTATEEWEEYSDIDLSIEDFAYDSSVLNIYKNQNSNSWTIEPLTFSNEPSTITVTYGDITRQFNIVVFPSSMFMLMLNENTPINDHLEITNATDVSIRESTDMGTTWNFWSADDYTNRSYSFTSADTSIVSTSGNTLIPNPNKSGQSTTISVIIEGQSVSTFTVEIGQISTYYKAGPMVNNTIDSVYINKLQSTNTVSWESPTQGDLFGIQFFIDSSGNTVREIYCDGINTAPFYGSYSGGMITITYSSGSATSVSIPIYTDSTKTTLLGSITLNKV